MKKFFEKIYNYMILISSYTNISITRIFFDLGTEKEETLVSACLMKGTNFINAFSS